MEESKNRLHQSSLKRKILIYLAIVLCVLLLTIGSGVAYFTYLAERNAWQVHQKEATANAAFKPFIRRNHISE